MRELSVIYDCSWIIQSQALFQKVFQVVTLFMRDEIPKGIVVALPGSSHNTYSKQEVTPVRQPLNSLMLTNEAAN